MGFSHEFKADSPLVSINRPAPRAGHSGIGLSRGGGEVKIFRLSPNKKPRPAPNLSLSAGYRKHRAHAAPNAHWVVG